MLILFDSLHNPSTSIQILPLAHTLGEIHTGQIIYQPAHLWNVVRNYVKEEEMHVNSTASWVWIEPRLWELWSSRPTSVAWCSHVQSSWWLRQLIKTSLTTSPNLNLVSSPSAKAGGASKPHDFLQIVHCPNLEIFSRLFTTTELRLGNSLPNRIQRGRSPPELQQFEKVAHHQHPN